MNRNHKHVWNRGFWRNEKIVDEIVNFPDFGSPSKKCFLFFEKHSWQTNAADCAWVYLALFSMFSIASLHLLHFAPMISHVTEVERRESEAARNALPVHHGGLWPRYAGRDARVHSCQYPVPWLKDFDWKRVSILGQRNDRFQMIQGKLWKMNTPYPTWFPRRCLQEISQIFRDQIPNVGKLCEIMENGFQKKP